MSELISGKDAYRLIGDGVEVEAHVELEKNLWRWEDAKHLPACDILNDGFDFRLKPRTITINGIQVPAPFEPKESDIFWTLSTNYVCGYVEILCYRNDEQGNRLIQFGAWRTEEEIKQAVAALRQVFGGVK